MLKEIEQKTAEFVAEQLKTVPNETRSYITGVLDGLKRADEIKAESAVAE